MAQFELYIPLLQQAEGGYQNLATDSGNYNSLGQRVGTNYGISAKTYEIWIGRPPSVADMKNITKAISLEIYKAWYWNKTNASSILNQSVANVIVDHAVNAGVSEAGEITQKTLNDFFGYNLVEDAKIGTQTINAINSVNQNNLHTRLINARKEFYEDLGGPHLTGWLNRLEIFIFDEKKKSCTACGQLLA